MQTTKQHIDNLNYYSDPRATAELETKAPVLCLETDDGGIDEIPLPTRWEVCPLCRGNGTHVNPAIDAGGLSADHFRDPDFAEDYRAGVYDVPCSECGGRTTVRVVDVEELDSDTRAAWERQQQEAAEARAQQLAELRMGA